MSADEIAFFYGIASKGPQDISFAWWRDNFGDKQYPTA